MMAQEIQIRCVRDCGFLVDSAYYERKTRFMPGFCARCGAPLKYVAAYTNTVAPGAEMGLDPSEPGYRKVFVRGV